MPHALPLVPASSMGSKLTVEQDHGAVIKRSILPGGVRVSKSWRRNSRRTAAPFQ